MARVVNPHSELIREPNLLIPGRKPVGSVKVNKYLFGNPNLEIIGALVSPGFDHVRNQYWTGTWSAKGGNTYINNATITQPGTGYVSSDPKIQRLWLFKLHRASWGNYYPSFYNGSRWVNHCTMHSETGGEVYAGVDALYRITPSDTSEALFETGAIVGAVWFGIYEDGVTYGNRLFKDGKMLVHDPSDSTAYIASVQGALKIESSSSLEVEYFIEIDVKNSYGLEVAGDGVAQQVVREFTKDPYSIFIPA